MGHLRAAGVLLSRQRRLAGLVLLALAALLVGLVGGCGSGGDHRGFTPGPSFTPGLSPAPSESSASPTATADDAMPTVAYADLPPEAHHTIDLIDQGGPYPYRQDDGIFSNREHLLPEEPYGYYREYTVETPGSPDRGARRIVAARDGTLYYTDDHYESFRRISR